jgi:hypothetical protein
METLALRLFWHLPLLLPHLLAAPVVAAEAPDFDRTVAPLLASRCLECHNPADKKGKLDLTTEAGLLRGGENGLVVERTLDDSLLWQHVRDDEMPPKKPLNATEKAVIKAWVEGGAKWGRTEKLERFAYTTDKHAGADFWSLQPVRKTAPPQVKAKDWPRNAIDHFVLAKLESKGLVPAPQADPRVLIRRVYFDLIGLPPTPKEIDDFVAEMAAEKATGPNPKPDPYERLIDRLLASPHHGERWARHWLDVARYTESQGFEYDRFRPNAWHYRDYVINAFNSDKPYDIFIQEQIAGDVMNFTTPAAGPNSQGLIATSLLVCGPYDQAGNSQANATQRLITREEELEDLVSVIGQTFLGLTVNCARCHTHKFDPIQHEDYYRIKSVFEGVKHGERAVATAEELKARNERITALNRAIADAERAIAEIEIEARRRVLAKLEPGGNEGAKPRAAAAQAMARWTFDGDAKDSIGAMHGELVGGATVRNGRLVVSGDKQFMRTAPLAKNVAEKTLEAWVILATLDQTGGGVITLESSTGVTFDSIVFGERQKRKWMAGSTGFARTKDVTADLETAGPADAIHMVIVYGGDGSIALFRNGKAYADAYTQDALQTYKAGDGRVVLGMRHTNGGNPFLKGEIDAAALYDRALKAEEVAALFAAGPRGGPVITQPQMLAAMTADQCQQRDERLAAIARLRAELAALPAMGVSYVGLREQPKPTHRLVRGSVLTPAELIAPAGLSIIKSPSPDFGLAPDAPEAQRRVKLAQWIADAKNPLTARVMVNRLWHHHFGRGLVDTPNDFGFAGGRPTHPELLDHLAATFIEKGWSIKQIHKLILMSATYRQASTFNTTAAAIDGDNTLVWRYAPRRIEGEIVRDAMLAVSGQLNPQLGGPSFKPFTVSNHGSDFYNLIDMIGPEFNRRTIYRAHVNSGKSAMMDALDCPDPSIKTPARRVTTTPLAALALMNNSFVQRQAHQFAERAMKEADSDEAKAIARAYRIAFGRAATAEELKDAAALTKEHGLQTLCWVLLNATEFMYVN